MFLIKQDIIYIIVDIFSETINLNVKQKTKTNSITAQEYDSIITPQYIPHSSLVSTGMHRM